MKRAGLFIGIDRYKDSGISQLRCAVKDATALMASFSKAQFDYVDSLLNSDAHCDNILDRVEAIVNDLNPGDLFVFYFSGHGREFGGTHYLVGPTGRANTELYQAGSLALPDLIAITNKPGVNRLFILDCCRSNILAGRSGAFFCDGSRNIALNAAVQGVSDKLIIPPLILSSCSTGEQAFEGDVHGYFTEALLRSIDSKTISSFQDFQRSLLITGAPAPQHISWNGNLTQWEKIILFKHWIRSKNTESVSHPGTEPQNEQSDPNRYIFEDLKAEIQRMILQLNNGVDENLKKILNRSERAEKALDFTSAVHFLEQAKSLIQNQQNPVKPFVYPSLDVLQIISQKEGCFSLSGSYAVIWEVVRSVFRKANFTVTEEDFIKGKIVGYQGYFFNKLIAYVIFYTSGSYVNVEFHVFLDVNSLFTPPIVKNKFEMLCRMFEQSAAADAKDFYALVPAEKKNVMPPERVRHEGVSYKVRAEYLQKWAFCSLFFFPLFFLIWFLTTRVRRDMERAGNFSGEECLNRAIIKAAICAVIYFFLMAACSS